MADTKLSALSAASAVADADLVYVVQSSTSLKGTRAQLMAAALTTAKVTITQVVATSGSPNALVLTGAAHTTLTASAEAIDANINLARTVQFATGALTTQRAVVIQAPTYAFVGASTITNAATLAITGPPVAGTNATLTNKYALWVQSGTVRIAGGGSDTYSLIVGTNFGDRFTINANDGAVNCYSIASTSGFASQSDFSFVLSESYLGIQFGQTYGARGVSWCPSGTSSGAAGSDVSITRADVGVAKITNGKPDAAGFGWLMTGGVARVTSNVTNATVTMANLTDLTLNVAAGRKYVGRVVFIAKDSTGADGLAFDFDGSTATMTSFSAIAEEAPIGATLGVTNSTALATDLTNTVVATTDVIYAYSLSFVVNAAGTFVPRFAQVAHTAGTATVELGSYIRLDDSQN